ncbi:MAG: hypothetical protein EHM19_11280 [Candidatus Latescibacterota bacterium]|nr:MAG: hypothetical protein EHM19_11280 [Candidatus Latescibacterota bacterium]
MGDPAMREKRFLLGVYLLALAVRLVYIADIRDNPFFEHPVLDEDIHHQWASRLARGEPWMPGEPFFRAPLYPYFLSLLFRIAGAGFTAPRVLQALLTSATPVLLYLLGRALLPRTCAATASLLLAVYAMLFYFDTGFLIEAIFIPLVLLSLLLLAEATSPGESRGDRRRIWFAAGLALGLSAIARPNVLLFLLVLPAWIFRAAKPGTARRAAAALLLGAALPIAPVFLHNAATGDPVLIAWQGGINFYIGNNPESDGMTAIAPGTEGTWWGGYRDMIRIAEESAGRTLRRSDVSDYWTGRAIAFLREEPGRAAALFAKKAYLVFNDFEVSNNQGIYFFRRFSGVFSAFARFGFGLLFPLAAAGAVLIRWDRRRALLPLFLATYAGSIVLFFVTARFRMPLVPVLMLPAATALGGWSAALRKTWDRRRTVSVAVFASALLFSNSNLYGLDRNENAQGHFNVGAVLLSEQRFREAIPHFLEALERKPKYVNARYNLGLCHSYLGELEEARGAFETLLAEHPEHAPARRALDSVLRREAELRRGPEGAQDPRPAPGSP